MRCQESLEGLWEGLAETLATGDQLALRCSLQQALP